MVLAEPLLNGRFLCVGGKLSLSIRSIQWPGLAALGAVVATNAKLPGIYSRIIRYISKYGFERRII
jgi:hypothetical protein